MFASRGSSAAPQHPLTHQSRALFPHLPNASPALLSVLLYMYIPSLQIARIVQKRRTGRRAMDCKLQSILRHSYGHPNSYIYLAGALYCAKSQTYLLSPSLPFPPISRFSVSAFQRFSLSVFLSFFLSPSERERERKSPMRQGGSPPLSMSISGVLETCSSRDEHGHGHVHMSICTYVSVYVYTICMYPGR